MPSAEARPGSLYRELAEVAPDGIFIANLEGRYIEVNAAGCELLGRTRDEILGKTIVDLIPAEQLPRLAESRELMLRGEVHTAEWQLRYRDGTYIPVEVSAKVLPDGRWVGFVRDLRHRKAMEEALRISEQRFRIALAGSPISLFSQDRDLRFTWSYNPPSPYYPHDIVGKKQEDFSPPALVGELTTFKRAVLETGIGARRLFEVEYAEGQRWFDVTIEPVHDERGQITGITGAAWDVTERKRSEDEHRLLGDASALLGELNTDWKELLSKVTPIALQLPADLCIAEVIDDDGQVQRLAIVHREPAMAAVCAALTALPLDRDRPHLAAEVLRSGQPRLIEEVTPAYVASVAQSAEHLNLLEQLHLRSLIEIPLVSRGRLLGMFVIGSSTRRFGAEDLRIAMALASRVAIAIDNARLHRSLQRAVEARDQVLAIVAHDLRNPLNSVLLQSEILSRSLDETIGVRAVERIRHAVGRMNRLVQDLLDAVRLDAHEPLTIEPEELAPDRVAQEAIEAMRPLAAA
ncbi:MAG: domain S-box, partial [Deltaproteobacteria bacterium]|nr:domain S-box [Deltaproteobacteria bacterium]